MITHQSKAFLSSWNFVGDGLCDVVRLIDVIAHELTYTYGLQLQPFCRVSQPVIGRSW